jgi:hypothetical protein
MINLRGSAAIAVLAGAVCLGTGLAQSDPKDRSTDREKLKVDVETYGVIPHRPNQQPGQEQQPAAAPTAGSTGVQTPAITYHGGSVMTTPNVYLIWYGNWNQSNGSDTAAAQAIVNDFLYGLNGSPYFQINISYGTPTGLVHVAGSTADAYSQGATLSDNAVGTVVGNAIGSGKLPNDSNGVYFVLTSSDVSERSGFCNKYCGWHTYGTLTLNNTRSNIRFAFIGNPNRCLSSCAPQTNSPNGNAGADGMVSIIAHELEETVTDPLLNGWYDRSGAENGDKCAWTFGQNVTSTNGAFYNMTLAKSAGGTRNYLVQRNLSASDSKCYVSPGKQ